MNADQSKIPTPTPPRDGGPRWLDKLLMWLVAPHLREEVLGDIHERYHRRAQRLGEHKARRTYWREVLAYVRLRFIKRKPSGYPSPFLLSPDMLRNYFTVAWRNLLRNRALSTINIVGLSAGLAAVMFILLFVQDEVSYDRFHAHGDDLYRVVLNTTAPDGHEFVTGATGVPEGPAFATELPEVADFCRMQGYEMLFRKRDEGIYQQVMYVDTSFFRLFSFKLMAGDPGTLLNDPGSVVVTDDIARKYFGTTDVVNRLMTIDAGGSFESYRITGVVKTPPLNSSIQFDVLRPFVASLPPDRKHWSENPWAEGFLNTFVLLRSGSHDGASNPSATSGIERKMAAVVAKYARQQLDQVRKESGAFSLTYQLQPFTDMHLNDRYELSNGLVRGSSSVYSYMLSGIAGLILLLACINFVNLTLARSLRRTKEIGIRKVTGSTRRQLIGQFVGETFLLTVLAFVPAVVLLVVLLPQFSTLANKALQLSFLINGPTLGLFAGLIIVVTLLAGLYPALVLSGFNPTQILYGRLRVAGRNRIGKSLLVLQFVIAIVLLIGTAVLHGQFDYIQTADVGYERADRVRVYVPWGREKQGELLKQDLQGQPGIESVARKSGGHQHSTYYVSNKPVKSAREWIDDQYLSLVKVPIVAGRGLQSTNPADSLTNILVNETFVKQFLTAGRPAIGQIIQREDDNHVRRDLTVVGVVRDYQYRSLRDKPEPVLLQLGKPEQMNQLYVKLMPDQTQAGLQTIESNFKRLIPYQPFSYHFMEDDRLENYADDARWKQLITDAALLAILIAALGLFGLVSLTIEQRTKEIGIRKVLGASVLEVSQQLSLNFLKLVLIAFVIATPIGWYAARHWLDTFVYRMNLSVWLFGLVGLSVLCVALLTVSFQSIKAALMNPVRSLRSE